MGVAATLGQVCVTMAFTSGPPARVSVAGLTQVVFALGLDLLFHGPVVQPLTLAGIALVMAPTAWMMADRAAREAPPARPTASAPRVRPRPFRSAGKLAAAAPR